MLEPMKSIYSPAYLTLIAWLRSEREKKGLTMREVGQRIGVPHSWVGKVEIQVQFFSLYTMSIARPAASNSAARAGFACVVSLKAIM